MTSCGARDGLVTFDPAEQMRVTLHAPNRGAFRRVIPSKTGPPGRGRRERERMPRERRSFVMGSDVFEAEKRGMMEDYCAAPVRVV